MGDRGGTSWWCPCPCTCLGDQGGMSIGLTSLLFSMDVLLPPLGETGLPNIIGCALPISECVFDDPDARDSVPWPGARARPAIEGVIVDGVFAPVVPCASCNGFWTQGLSAGKVWAKECTLGLVVPGHPGGEAPNEAPVDIGPLRAALASAFFFPH